MLIFCSSFLLHVVEAETNYIIFVMIHSLTVMINSVAVVTHWKAS